MNRNTETILAIVKKDLLLFILLLAALYTNAQQLAHKKAWNAQWIAVPNSTGISSADEKAGVYKFRKAFELTTKPATFIIHVSADNRYKLYVNEQLVSLGPARGDLTFWNYETVDIAPYLGKGKNIIAALVWNMGELRPEAQVTYRIGFIVQGATATEEIINTNNTWKGVEDSSYHFIKNRVHGYYVAGPAEVVDMNKNISGWERINYNDADWKNALPIAIGHTKETAIDWPGWMLVPSSIPQMALKKTRIGSTRRVENISLPSSFPITKSTGTIPPNTTATILLDQGYIANAYTTLIFSKGKGARITLTYAEALYIPDTTGKIPDTLSVTRRFVTAGKGNRNEVEGKFIIGTKDSILSNGNKDQNFTSLWWRTYRYIQVNISTGNEAIEINDIYGTFTGYPFTYKASFKSKDSTIEKILDIGWRTARLCAFETYMDCPYYEQLQYAGDTRIQALVSIYNSGDDRLMRNAIKQLDHSRMAEGLTRSRWPSVTPQQIPPFSLWYIGMLHDYWWYRPDTNFVKECLPGMRQILWWFSKFQNKDGSLVNVPYWNYTDHLEGEGWERGRAPISRNGTSAAIDLQLCWALQLATTLEDKLGLPDLAKQYKQQADQLKITIKKKYWNATKLMFGDTEEKNVYSQHTN
ncbi:MAG TPA: hypothetical protein VM888_12195, partial [Chitinophagaceae bacterium]|nr:hypothetical protein [Chitinophagaceae bacterium]